MIKGLYIAGTSMNGNIKKMNIIGNNLANVQTTGFKRDTLGAEAFNARLQTRINGTKLPFKSGQPQVWVDQNGAETRLTTDKGYFRVATPNGIHYGVDVQFLKDEDGYLRTPYKSVGGILDPLAGNLVLDATGKPVSVGDGAYEVDENGVLTVDGGGAIPLVMQAHRTAVGTIGAGLRSYTVYTDWEQGQLEMTENDFDLALKGDGFFSIRTPQGDFYTRNGVFTRNAVGELVTLDGYPVLGLKGPIVVGEKGFAVNSFGEIIQNGEIIDKLALTTFSNPSDIYKKGNTFYTERTPLKGEKMPYEGDILQGYKENSNVDAISEMIRLIEMNRNYESNQKVITTIDDLIGKCVNEVGKV